MTRATPSDDALPVSAEVRIDAVCRRFEAAWQAVGSGGPRPALADSLKDAAEPERPGGDSPAERPAGGNANH